MIKYQDIKEAFELLSDEEKARQMSAYMRDRFRFYGIQTPQRRGAYKSFLKTEVKNGRVDYALLNECWADPHREFQYFVTDYLNAVADTLTFDDIHRIEIFIRSKQWWDTIDSLDTVVGKIVRSDPRGPGLMLRWAADSDFWVRRTAIDHQLKYKELTDTKLLEKIICMNFGSNEFFINKAIGWSLREYSKTSPGWVREFIARHRTEMSALSIREASKYI